MSKFGWELCQNHYQFADGVVNLNHGSYGVPPTEVLNARIDAIKEEMAFPDKYIRLVHDDISLEARKILAKHLHADVNNLVLTVNATTAINAVLRSFPYYWCRSPKIVTFKTIYGSCNNTIDFVKDRYGVEIRYIDVDFPVDKNKIVSSLVEELDTIWKEADANEADRKEADDSADEKFESCVIVMFDTISSMPGVLFPWEELVATCKRYKNTFSLVDGAHGIGIIPIDLEKTKPDFFTTNAHKWFGAAHSVAALYVDPRHQSETFSLPVSANYFPDVRKLSDEEKKTALARSFVYVGTADHSAVQSLTAAHRFRQRVCGGEEKIREYQNDLSRRAADYLCDTLNTTEVQIVGVPNNRVAMFTLVYPYQPPAGKSHDEMVKFCNEYMMKEWKTIMPISSYNGIIYMRGSATTYLDLDDFKFGAKAVEATIKAYKEFIGESNIEII